ncbi:MAG: fumarylacetoacetate hydrolase family protein [Alphaproteobacteria bacterium]
MARQTGRHGGQGRPDHHRQRTPAYADRAARQADGRPRKLQSPYRRSPGRSRHSPSNTALIGASDTIPIRFPDRRNDHEFEFVIVIGKECSNVSKEDALDVIAGYTLGLDMTVRGPEDRSARKSCDGYAVLGPWFVTADEIADPDDVAFHGSVNGEVKQDANTSDQVLSIRELIEYASQYYTLYPGDIMYTGSGEGRG